jgi:hypothetical protein
VPSLPFFQNLSKRNLIISRSYSLELETGIVAEEEEEEKREERGKKKTQTNKRDQR